MTPEQRGVIDTNVVINLADVAVESLPDEPVITAITLAELAVGPLVANCDDERAARQQRLVAVAADFESLAFDSACARAFGTVAAGLRGAGRKSVARAFDALIAATALAHRLPLYTENIDDFRGIDGLEVHRVLVDRVMSN